MNKMSTKRCINTFVGEPTISIYALSMKKESNRKRKKRNIAQILMMKTFQGRYTNKSYTLDSV